VKIGHEEAQRHNAQDTVGVGGGESTESDGVHGVNGVDGLDGVDVVDVHSAHLVDWAGLDGLRGTRWSRFQNPQRVAGQTPPGDRAGSPRTRVSSARPDAKRSRASPA
jgi:hypothetical protein